MILHHSRLAVRVLLNRKASNVFTKASATAALPPQVQAPNTRTNDIGLSKAEMVDIDVSLLGVSITLV